MSQAGVIYMVSSQKYSFSLRSQIQLQRGEMWSEKSAKVFLKSRQPPPEGQPGTPSTVVVPVNTLIPSTDNATSTSTSTSDPRTPPQNLDSQSSIVAITAASLALIVAFIFAFYFLRHCRQMRNTLDSSSNYNIFKSLWSKTKISNKKNRIQSTDEQQFSTAPREHVADTNDSRSLEMAENFERPDRTASFRSVITLPSYIPTARQDEQVLGREGERGGIDVVVEFPTTAEEEEQRREEEMEALYQVRLARRRENQSREERRRTRRATRDRGESSTPRENGDGRRHSMNVPGQTIEELRSAHERLKSSRQRAVSIVSYAEIGVARHDGSRLNPGTPEIEQIGLLGDAASISANPYARGRNGSIRSIGSMSSEIPYPLMPQLSNPSNSSTFAPQTQFNAPPYILNSEPENNFTSPSLFRLQIWESPRVDSNAQSSTVSIIESANVVQENTLPENIPPDYTTIPFENSMEPEELPPNYSISSREYNEQNVRANETDLSSSEINENNDNIANTAMGSDGNELDSSVSSPDGNVLSIRTQILPSIQINLASPTADRGIETPFK